MDAGGGDGWLHPNWWRPVGYSCSSSRGSSSYTSTPGTTSTLSPSPYTNLTPSPQSSRRLDLMSCQHSDQKEPEYIKCFLQGVAKGDVSISTLETVLGVGRQIADDASATSLLHFAGIWIRALVGITGSVRTTFLADIMLSTSVEEEQPSQHINSARSAETCILTMLPFVDALVAPYCLELVGDGAPAPAEKLRPLIDVREAVSRASQDIRLSFCATSSQEAKRITDGVANLLLAKESKLDEAIWSTMEETSARLVASTDMEDDDVTWWGTHPTPQGSPNIHMVTREIVSYINLLSTRWATVHQIVEQAVQFRRYMPKIDNVSPLASLIMETVACLEKMLSQKSDGSSFPDQSLGFLFLINNSYFIWQQLYPTTSVLESHMFVLARKIDNYIETYLQLSWAPVLSCLFNSTPLCLGRYSSPAKFEAEFHKTYTAQKLWKVPDPKLRRRLRVAVIEKVIPSFTKYLEYNNISPSRITPQDLMDMLQELFEG